MRIVAESLSYTYSEKSKKLAVKALSDVSLTIEEGDCFGIIGRTGSGKSTFVQHLNGLIGTDKRNVSLRVGEFDVSDKKCDFNKLRSKVGMVFQYPEYQLFAETVKDDVAFAYKNFFPSATAGETENAVRNALALVGLSYEDYKDKSPFELSGGQKRRVAIAGVLVARPEVLVLDEPVAGLDPSGKKEFLNIIRALLGNTVKTVIIVSHDMNVVADNCNRVAVFDAGRVVSTGSVKEVFSDGEKMKKAGLDVPVTAKIEERLAKSGIFVDSDLSRDGFCDEIVALYKSGKILNGEKRKNREGEL